MNNEEFCYIDLWAAEAYLTALDAKERELLSLLNAGIKIHQWMWDQTKAKFPNELPESAKSETGYNYHKAKQTIHASNYGAKAEKLSQESQLPLYVTEWQSNLYHTKFPNIRERMWRIKKEILATHITRNLLGREKRWLAPINDEIMNKVFAWSSQSLIGELTILAMTKLYYIGKQNDPWIFPAMNTHDGLVLRVKTNTRQEVKTLLTKIYNLPLKYANLSITIPIDVGWAKNFNDIEDKEIIRFSKEL
jgi:hypothetical protein